MPILDAEPIRLLLSKRRIDEFNRDVDRRLIERRQRAEELLDVENTEAANL